MKPRSINPSSTISQRPHRGPLTPVDQSISNERSQDSADALEVPEEFNEANDNDKANSSDKKKRLRFEPDERKSNPRVSNFGLESLSSPTVEAALKYINAQKDSGRSSKSFVQPDSQKAVSKIKSPTSTKQVLQNILNKTYFSSTKEQAVHPQQKEKTKANSSQIASSRYGINVEDSVPKHSNDLKTVDAIRSFSQKSHNKSTDLKSLHSPTSFRLPPGKPRVLTKKQDAAMESPGKEDIGRKAPNQSNARVRLSQEIKGDVLKKSYLSDKTNLMHTHKQSKRSIVVDENRLLESQKKKEQKMQRIRDLELEGCTFQPQINPGHNSRRSLHSFLQDQSNFLISKEVKNQQLKQSIEKEMQEIERNQPPKITDRSRSLVEVKRKKERDTRAPHDRLYERSKSPKMMMHRDASAPILSTIPENTEQTVEYSFQPKIDERSKKLKRNESVQDILYNDALRRREKSAENSKHKKDTRKILYMNEQSKRFLARRLIREFEITSEEFFEGFEGEHKFNYLHMCNFLKALRFLRNNEDTKNPYFVHERTLTYDMWVVLRGDKYNGVNERNLLVMLLAIMGLNLPIPPYVHSTPQKQPVENENQGENPSDSINQAESNQPKLNSVTFGRQDQKLLEQMMIRKENSQSAVVEPTNTEDQTVAIANRNMSLSHSLIDQNKEAEENQPRVQIGSFDDKENIYFTDEEVHVINHVYDVLYANRLYSTERKPVNAPQHSFAPKILERSKKLADAFREKQLTETANYIIQTQKSPPSNVRLTHADLLILHKSVQNEKLEEKKKEYIKKELEECSFAPKITESKGNITQQLDVSLGNIRSPTPTEFRRGLNSAAKSKPKRDKTYVEWYDEKYKDECTFKPAISTPVDRSRYINQSLENIRDVDKSIERAKKGREQRRILNEAKSFRGTSSNEMATERVSAFNFSMEKGAGQNQITSKRDSSAKTVRKDHSIMNRSVTPVNDITRRSTPIPNFPKVGVSDSFRSEQNNVTNDSPLRKGDHQRNSSTVSRSGGGQSSSSFQQDTKMTGAGKTERISVYSGDTAADLAVKFSREHNLNEVMQGKLQELLEVQIAGITAKLDKTING